MLRKLKKFTLERLPVLIKSYEDAIGLSEVKVAQQRVLMAEKSFTDTQELRRNGQIQMQEIQVKLKELQLELDKTSRVEDRYLLLVTQQHNIIKDERRTQEELKLYEKEEREKFTSLANSVRESHEKERSYAEKTKYWSLIGSVTGAIVGILGTAYNNRKRLTELRYIVIESTATSSSIIQDIRSLLTDVIKDKQQISTSFGSIPNTDYISAQENISKQLVEIRSFLKDHRIVYNVDKGKNKEVVTYIGKDVEEIVKESETRLRNQLYSNTAITIFLMAITVSIIHKFFNS